MSEKLGGGSGEVPFEWTLSNEKREKMNVILSKLDLLLAQIIEKGADLDPYTLKQLRARLKEYLAMLSHVIGKEINGLEDLAKIYDYTINLDITDKIPTPQDYPSKEEFEKAYYKILYSGNKKDLPKVPKDIPATMIAAFAQDDWYSVKARGTNPDTVDYLYNLGRLMCSKTFYKLTFKKDDGILIGNRWQVENGRHRSLTLRVLGEAYVSSTGMNSWVKAEKE